MARAVPLADHTNTRCPDGAISANLRSISAPRSARASRSWLGIERSPCAPGVSANCVNGATRPAPSVAERATYRSCPWRA